MRPPQPSKPYVGIHYAQKFGDSCPQQKITLPNGLDLRLVKNIGTVVNKMYEGITPSSEDCKGCVVLIAEMS